MGRLHHQDAEGVPGPWAVILCHTVSMKALVRPTISEEQEAFILKVTEIPLEEWRCRDLITPNALHVYCGGPVPTEEARRLSNLSRQEMESAKLRAQIRAAAARKRKRERGKRGRPRPSKRPSIRARQRERVTMLEIVQQRNRPSPLRITRQSSLLPNTGPAKG
ncbi:hypothetical protein SO802_013416 [Lithocarpus litseifolius]|uniref:Uncharacterized protein n=1 Tax=Lithocarpus litseifolius TaxID=425828 RepID=A0AAW2D985_9ROSI